MRETSGRTGLQPSAMLSVSLVAGLGLVFLMSTVPARAEISEPSSGQPAALDVPHSLVGSYWAGRMARNQNHLAINPWLFLIAW